MNGIVNGLDIQLPISNGGNGILKNLAHNTTRYVCRPIYGDKPINTPKPHDKAIFLGGTSMLNISCSSALNRSLSFGLFFVTINKH